MGDPNNIDVVGAHHSGAPHRRDRCWILAYANDRAGCTERECQSEVRPELADGMRADGSPHVAYAKGIGRRDGQHDEASRGGWNQLADGGCDVPDADSRLRDGRADQPKREAQGGTAVGGDGQAVSNPQIQRLEGPETARNPCADGRTAEHGHGRRDGHWWLTEPNVGGMADGLATDVDTHGATNCGDSVARVASRVPNRNDRIKSIGNGQVPAAMILAWKLLTERD